MSHPASPLAATAAQTAMELRLTARRGENVLVTVIVPAVVLVFFASAGILTTPGERPVDFLLPGAIALAIIATSLVNLGIATAYERSYGVLKRLGGSPLTRANLVIAKIAVVLLVEAFQVALLVTVATVVLGWSASPGLSPALLLLAWILGTAAFAGLGLILAGTLRAEGTLAAANAMFLVTLLVGGILQPIERLPAPVSLIAGMLPAAALADALRVGLGSGGNAIGPVGILVGWAAASVIVAARTFRWE
jgi:ABC-2 type transport system permease protein